MGKRVASALAAFIMVLAPLVGKAAVISVSEGDWIGGRASDDGLLVTGGRWAETSNNGIEVQWEINFDGSLYDYTYSFQGAGGSPLSPDISHWILEVSDPSVPGDFIDPSVSFSGDSPGTFVERQGNPDMPDTIYGLKFETKGKKDSSFTYAFQTAREPVWGDLYIKDGKKGRQAFTTAWNTGFGEDPDLNTSDFDPWIPRPDGGTTAVPIPASVFLLGGGLLALVVARRRPNR